MTILQSIFMGIIQGVSEFLPISSSGHLAILQYIFNITEGNLSFSIMLHFATLMSVLVIYFKDIIKIIYELFGFILSIIKKNRIKLGNNAKLGLLIIVGNIPTFIIALLFKDSFEAIYQYPVLIAIFFIITGFLLIISTKRGKEFKNISSFTYLDAIIIGFCQSVAMLPGISRSGMTISVALFLGLKRDIATKFSFLLSAPVIFGAFIFDLADINNNQILSLFSIQSILGMITAFVVGILTIKLLIKLLQNRKFYYFSYYLWTLGITILIYLALRGVIIG